MNTGLESISIHAKTRIAAPIERNPEDITGEMPSTVTFIETEPRLQRIDRNSMRLVAVAPRGALLVAGMFMFDPG